MIRVVLADDQSLVRAGFRMLLEACEDIEVVGEAPNGGAAVALARELMPDVVLMDLRMPDVDGLTATERISADPRLAPVKVVALTTFDDEEHVFAALRAGASGFLVKDVEPEELLQAVRVVARGDALLAPSVTRALIAAFTAGRAGMPASGSAASGGPESARPASGAGIPGVAAPGVGTPGVGRSAPGPGQFGHRQAGPEQHGGHRQAGAEHGGPQRQVAGTGMGASARRPRHPGVDALTDREREVVALVAAGLSNDEIAARLVVSPLTAKTHVSRAMTKVSARDRAQLVVIAYEHGLTLPPDPPHP